MRGINIIMDVFGIDHWAISKVCAHAGDTRMAGNVLVCCGCDQVLF